MNRPPTPEKIDVAKTKRNRCIIIVIAVVVIAAIAGGLIGYFVNKKSSSSNKDSSSGTNSGGGSTSNSMPMVHNQLVGYFGQNAIANGVDIVKGTNGRNTSASSYQGTLATYCSTGYYNTINLAFLNLFGGGNGHFAITFGSFNVPNYAGVYTYTGNGLESNPQYVVQNFIKIGQDITACQAQGVKIILSLGGDKVSAYQFAAGDGAAYATLFYNTFLEGTAGPVRPFGPGVVLDGIELDVEKNDNPAVWTAEMINFVTSLRKLSPSTKLAIVPQCYLGLIGKDESVGDVIAAVGSITDYLIVQYYNNPQCSYPFGFNFAAWKPLFPGSIIVGLAGDWTSAISGGFLAPGPLQAVYDMVASDPQFGGFSVYDVSSSNPPAMSWDASDYANPPPTQYSQTLRNVLNGKTVGSGFPAQGPQQSNINLRSSCGGTWVYANQTCTLQKCDPTLPNPGCGVNQQCFTYLANTC
ncbi:Acidic endochitinase [Podochytrium sp. JEL0797]|nr:Acidic endochitinase [Podochytrium sp. JEL0797]